MRKNSRPSSDENSGLDLSIVLSLAGIITVASTIGVMAFQNGAMQKGSNLFTSIMEMSPSMMKMIPSMKNKVAVTAPSELDKKIAKLEKQLSLVNKQISEISRTQYSTTRKVAEFEESFVTFTGSIPKATTVRQTSQDRLLETGWDADGMVTRKRKQNRIPFGKQPAKKKDRQSNLMSKSTHTATQFAVELALYKNIVTARSAWDKLSQDYSDMLKNLEPRLLPALNKGHNNGRVKLVAGPIKNAAKAAKICASLRSSGIECQERVYSSAPVTIVSASKNNAVPMSNNNKAF